ncbi:MAG: hypothetical protein ABFR53_03410 [Actinomycetota bacterium]
MDASQRWETEALRSGSHARKSPPRPSAKRQTDRPASRGLDGTYVTLKHAEAATGIPVNTLRKWARKNAIPTYLKPDGDISLRMVDLDAIVAHAHDLGREVTLVLDDSEPEEVDEGVDVEPIPDEVVEDDATDDTVDEVEAADEAEPEDEPHVAETPIAPEGTLLVPLDSWNKMLNQLGNLHEAGQQLAEARERAAKAETEAKFLRERLAEMRAQNTETRQQTPDTRHQIPEATSTPAITDEEPPDEAKPTTSYWRYVTLGWRDRKKRASKKK